VIIDNSLKSVHLAVAMKEMFHKDITLILYTDRVAVAAFDIKKRLLEL